MKVWTVVANYKSKDLMAFNPAEVSDPYISAQRAMNDYFYSTLDWKHVEVTKFGGTVLEYWQAEDNEYEFLLESHHVIGSENGDLENCLQTCGRSKMDAFEQENVSK